MDAPETASQFWVVFNERVRDLRSRLADPPASETQDFVLRAKTSLADLQHYATISTIVLPAYDIKRSQDTIESVNKEIKALDATLHPRKKFQFSNRNRSQVTAPGSDTAGPTEAKESAEVTTKATQEGSTNKAASLLPPGAYVISDRQGETIDVTPETLAAAIAATATPGAADVQAQLFIKGAQNCHITVPSLLGSVRIEQTSDCDIKLGACCTSVYLDGVTNCTIQILSHQLRIHDCKGCRLYVRVQSHPIIEDCADMGFAPYAYNYPGSALDITTAGLQSAHHWNTVVDFRWHKTTHSPNWYEIPALAAAGVAAGAGDAGGVPAATDLPAEVAVTPSAGGSGQSGAAAGSGQAQEDDDEF